MNEKLDQKKIRDIVKKSGSSFYWGMNILEPMKKRAMFSVYAFCRIVDDIADSEKPNQTKMSELQDWKKKIEHLYNKKPSDFLSRELLFAISKFKLLKVDFLSIIDGMKMDIIEEIRYPSNKTINLYCDRVAGAVGCLSMSIFGYHDKKARKYACSLGKAFQFTNILRDLKEDSLRNRCYIPLEIINKQNLIKLQPIEIIKDPRFKKSCNRMIEITLEHYKEAEKLSMNFNKKDIKAAVLMKEIYFSVFKKISNQKWDINKKIKLSKMEKIIIIFKLLIKG